MDFIVNRLNGIPENWNVRHSRLKLFSVLIVICFIDTCLFYDVPNIRRPYE